MQRVDRWPLEIGVAALSLEREVESGDQHVVAPFSHGTLVAVVDGLGRGQEAARAASLAVQVLLQRPDDAPVVLLWRCNEALARTRGAALGLALFDDQRRILHWAGVGSIWGCYFSSPRAPATRQILRVSNGVVGSRLVTPVPVSIAFHPNDTLVLATNGVRCHEVRDLPRGRPAQQVAEEILERHKAGVDDAVVLVARCAEAPVVTGA